MPGKCSRAFEVRPAYESARRATMILDRECRVADAPREAERLFWDSLPSI